MPIVLGVDRESLAPLLTAHPQAVRALWGCCGWIPRPACDIEGGNVLGEALTAQLRPPSLLASGCALVGLRQATRAEARFLRERELLALTMEDVDLLDVREVMRRALDRVTGLGHGFALCLHGSAINDVADPTDAGLSYRECSLAMELVAATRDCARSP